MLIGLTAFFKKAAEWFQNNKNINIIPASLIEMVAVFIFLGTYGSEYTDEIIWMWVSVAIVVAITIFNLIKDREMTAHFTKPWESPKPTL